MSVTRFARFRPWRDETGASLVVVVLALPILLLCATFAIDTANWFVHKRHLQTQADAAALAAVQEINFQGGATCNNANVVAMARQYALTYNPQVSGTPAANVHIGDDSATPLNKTTYFGYPDNSPPPDDTNVNDPCSSKQVDVKLTETDLKLFFPFSSIASLADLHGYVNAHARAEVLQRGSSADAAPIGIPDSTPREAWVWLVDEAGTFCGGTSSRCVVAGQKLVKTGPLGGGLTGWATAPAAPLDASFAGVGSRLSLVVALSGNNPGTLSGVLATDCARTLVQCLDASAGSPPASGLTFVHTYSTAAVSAPTSTVQDTPVVRDVRLSDPSCTPTPDAYFSTCTGTELLTANVDFGMSGTDPRGPSGTEAALTAQVGGNPYPMAPDTSDPTWQRWTATIPITASGANDISIKWIVKKNISIAGNSCRTGQGCSAVFNTVQRAFVASGISSGPVQLAQIGESSGPPAYATVGADSFPRCATGSSCSHSLTVTLGIAGRLTNDTHASDPPITLRFGNGSQTGFAQCDPSVSSSDAVKTGDLAHGCNTVRYTKFTGVAPWDSGCPANANGLISMPMAWQCVATAGGATPNVIGSGVNARVLCGGNTATCNNPTCTHVNNWRDPVTGIEGKIDPSDPRIVTLFITPYGSFQGTGSQTYPIQDFGTFYITGWDGQGSSKNPCQPGASGTAPLLTNIHHDDVAGSGEVVGHYFKFVDPTDNGNDDGQVCDPNAFGGCVAKLTR